MTIVILLILSPACQKQKAAQEEIALTYPVTQKGDVVDDYFGTKVPDPYRWLEDDNAEEVKQWVQEQNEVTFDYLDQIPFREKIQQRVTELYNYPRYSSPHKVGEHYFFYKNDGLQDQSVIYIQKGMEGDPEVFIDPNSLSADGTVRIQLAGFSHDDRYVTLTRSEAGSDWRELRIMEIETREELPDRIHWIKFAGATWYGDGFYYGGYDKPQEGQELTAENLYMKIYYHKLGDPQEKDTLLYEDPAHPHRYMWTDISEDERYLFLTISEGTSGNELYYSDLTSNHIEFKPLITGFKSDSNVVETVEEGFLVYTNKDALNYRVVLIKPDDPAQENWDTVIPEKEDVLNGASAAGGDLFCFYLKDVSTRIFQHNLDGSLVREIELPAIGTAYGLTGKRMDDTAFYTFTSFTYPPSVYTFEIESGESEVFKETDVPFDPEDFVSKQVFYPSKDGTLIPMFLVYKKGLKKNGKNPVFLYAYGGFNISKPPSFLSSSIFLLENGGIFAQACIRGGGEYGEEWHKAGMLHNKQNVFDDFIAAAEYLIEEKFTSKEYLALDGGSNGGLLVGACMTQRPDLCKVAFPRVGVMDMLRYHKFTVGWGWVVEYGSSDEEEHFHNLYAYSPLHNIKKGVSYPATFVMTADHDDRVVPAHSFKFAAALQEKHIGPAPVLIRIETRSGHGASSTTKRIEQQSDKWVFMFYNMGLDPNFPF